MLLELQASGCSSLGGTLPSSYSALTRLTRLDVSADSLSSTVPA